MTKEKLNASHWSKEKENTSVWGIRLLLGLYRLLGRGVIDRVIYPITALYWLANPRARAASKNYLAHIEGAFPHWRNKLSSFTHFQCFAKTLFERFLVLTSAEHSLKLHVNGLENLDLDNPRGAIVLTAHMGCRELLAMSAIDYTSHPIVILEHNGHATQFKALLEKLGKPLPNVRHIEIGAIDPALIFTLSDEIENGSFVVIASDRIPISSDTKGVRVHPFFKSDALWPIGGPLLSYLLKVPLYQMLSIREPLDKASYRVDFFKIQPELTSKSLRRSLYIDQSIKASIDNMETMLNRSPYDWFNFFNFWSSSERR